MDPREGPVLCDLTPRQLLSISGRRLQKTYRRAMEEFRYGPGVFKIDYALSAPIPWAARECNRAITVHLGGTLEEIARSERAVAHGMIADRPFMLVAQPSLFDSTRAPEGKHVAWVYCHVPNATTVDMTSRMEAQLERYAPGFKAVSYTHLDVYKRQAPMRPRSSNSKKRPCELGKTTTGTPA